MEAVASPDKPEPQGSIILDVGLVDNRSHRPLLKPTTESLRASPMARGRPRPVLLHASAPVGGEFPITRQLESGIDRGNVAAKRDDRARQEQVRMRQRVARVSSHRALLNGAYTTWAEQLREGGEE